MCGEVFFSSRFLVWRRCFLVCLHAIFDFDGMSFLQPTNSSSDSGVPGFAYTSERWIEWTMCGVGIGLSPPQTVRHELRRGALGCDHVPLARRPSGQVGVLPKPHCQCRWNGLELGQSVCRHRRLIAETSWTIATVSGEILWCTLELGRLDRCIPLSDRPNAFPVHCFLSLYGWWSRWWRDALFVVASPASRSPIRLSGLWLRLRRNCSAIRGRDRLSSASDGEDRELVTTWFSLSLFLATFFLLYLKITGPIRRRLVLWDSAYIDACIHTHMEWLPVISMTRNAWTVVTPFNASYLSTWTMGVCACTYMHQSFTRSHGTNNFV